MARSRLFPLSVDPGKPVEPPCPDGWVRRRFGEILDEVRRPVGLDPKAEYQLVNAKRNREGISPRERRLGRDIKVKSQFYVHTGDFVMSKRQIVHGGCGVVPVGLDGAVVSNEYLVVQPSEEIRIDYLSYLSHTPYFQRTCFHSSIGVDVEKMVFKEDQWMRFQVPVPPIPEQRKIAAILSLVDEVIEKTEAVIEQLQVVKKAMTQELLTRGLPRRHTRFKHTEIGEIPEEWGTRRLVECARRITAGGTPKVGDPTYYGGEIPFLKIDDITTNGGLYAHAAKTSITQKALDETSAKLYPAGTVLVTMYGTIGATTITGVPMAANQAIAAFLDLDGLDREFLAYLLESEAQKLAAKAGKTTQANISGRILKKHEVAVPPLSEQREIAVTLTAVNERAEQEGAVLISLRDVRASLTSVLLTGEVRVTPDEQVA